MRSLKGVTFAVVATMLAAAAQAGAAGSPTTVTKTYTVGSSAVPGVSTGLDLQAGQSVTVKATGIVCFAGWYLCYGPGGNPAQDTTQSSWGGFVLPGAPAWGLVGRVGNGPWVQVGSGPTTLSGTGELVFAVNDDLLGDNQGTFTATVTYTYTCYPGWGYGDKNHTHCGPPGLGGAAESKPTPAKDQGGSTQASPHAAGCAAPPCGRGPKG